MGCIICGSEIRDKVLSAPCPDAPRGEIYTLAKCAGCGLVFVDPLPKTERLKDLYFYEYYGADTGLLSKIKRFLDAFLIARRRKKIESRKKRGSILDIGCGSGAFLNEMLGHGWDAHGVEPCDAIRLSLDIKDKIESDIDAYLAGGRKFDVITLWYVFEHLPEPEAALRKIGALLKPDGMLFLSIPDFNSYEASIGKEKWFHLDLPRHLFFFTPATISALLARNGFAVAETNHLSWEYNFYGLFQTFYNLIGCEMNFFYKKYKWGHDFSGTMSRTRYALNLAAFYALFLPILALSMALPFMLSAIKRTGIIEVYAFKNGMLK